MNIKIYTIQSRNYGNRLQNYATQEFLNSLGHTVKTINTELPKSITEILIAMCKNAIKRLMGYPTDFFAVFNKKFIKKTKRSEYISKTHYNVNECDAVIAGSDQIWNINFPFVSINAFLPFKGMKKISFSASFGVDSIPYDKQIASCLNDFAFLSVREKAGAKIIKDFTGRNAEVLIDPTLLLSNEEWRKISEKPKHVDNGFILTYFLSPMSDQANRKLAELSEQKRIYEIPNPDYSLSSCIGPSEFLWLFDHADIVLTDSFHACVFSFLFDKPFIVYDRNWNECDMNSRLETFLAKFCLERKYASSGLENDIWEHDYAEGYKQLDLERKKAMNFLEKALEE